VSQESWVMIGCTVVMVLAIGTFYNAVWNQLEALKAIIRDQQKG